MSASDELTDNRVVSVPPVAPAVRAAALRARTYEIARFLSVGGIAFVVDLGLFNLLRFGPGEVLGHKPLTAKVISVIAATLVSWLGNRHWTFSRQRTERRTRELAVFATINIVCAGIPLLTLAFSHYTLGLTTPLADNVATVIGIGIGTVLRYLGYKRWVFTGRATPPPA
ncbi:polysaccharide synthesis protein GtrA [Cellulomonas sp. Root485]|uniref:GtrA family protein n=1 Tax=Cellulomonas sp. Root485 TaxID=1736546 RepID=UPI0006F3C084|nr:GtrA family protein [Cellulomonas sp. Root485]KQY24575.1 polysaccharide synthesis protein GtrA [Cellulomonas sp. Root485]